MPQEKPNPDFTVSVSITSYRVGQKVGAGFSVRKWQVATILYICILKIDPEHLYYRPQTPKNLRETWYHEGGIIKYNLIHVLDFGIHNIHAIYI